MPIYEFQCMHCSERFSQFYRSISAAQSAEVPPCPACGHAETRRIVSSFAVHGPSSPDAQQIAHDRSQAEREASVTSREQIDRWRTAKP